MSVYEMARKYYPRLWGIARLDTLLAAGRLTQAEYDDLTAKCTQTYNGAERPGGQ